MTTPPIPSTAASTPGAEAAGADGDPHAQSGLPLAERATVELRQRILSFALRPGERLPERRLEGLLGASRSPVRQALATLAGEGLVRREGRGYRVAPVDTDELEELYAFRALLETSAVRRAAESGASTLGLEAILQQLDRDMEPEARLAATARLHLGLARLGGNRFVVEALAALLPRVSRARYLELGSRRKLTLAGREHRRIVELVGLRRGDEAAALLERHLERTLHNLLDSLERQAVVRAIVGERLP